MEDEMKNPFGDQQLPGSYENLKERLHKRVSGEVSDRMFRDLQSAYENALSEANVVLSRPERKRMFSQVITMVMDDMVKRLG